MSVDSIIEILREHGINFRVNGSTIWAKDEWLDMISRKPWSKWVNLSEWNRDDIYSWLGY